MWIIRFILLGVLGAWDVIGIHLKLIQQAGENIPLTWFVPSGPGPAFEGSRKFVARHIGDAEVLDPKTEKDTGPFLAP